MRRLRELLGRLQLALGVDHLGPALALGFGLARHRALHLRRQIDVLYFDGRHLDAPVLRARVDRLAQDRVDLIAVREQLVHFGLAQHRPQRRLRELARGVEVVLDCHDSPVGRLHTHVQDGIDLDGDVVARDHVLGWDVDRHHAQRHLLHSCQHRGEKDQPRSLRGPETAQQEVHAALVFAQHAQARKEIERDHTDRPEEYVAHNASTITAAP